MPLPSPALRDRLIDNETGIVRWLSEIPVEPGEPEVFNFSAKMCDSGKYFPVSCFDNNGGAGLTREWAYRAAVGEAVERYCASVYFPEDFPCGTLTEVAQYGRVLGPPEIALFHPAQKERLRYEWFTEESRICWTPIWSLTNRETVLVPASLIHIPYFPFRRDQGEVTIAPGVSTGQACADSIPAALLSGTYEIVERDAFMISWLNRLPLPRIDIDSSPSVSRVFHERFERNRIEYHLYLMASDLRIPAVLCLVIDRDRDPPLICMGGAAHLDPETASIKALLEAAQTREWAKFMGQRSEPFIIDSEYTCIDDFEKHVFLYGHGGMLHAVEYLLDAERRITFADIPRLPYRGDPRVDVRTAITEIESRGYETMAVDLTSSDARECGYIVVKAFIPLLQPMEGDHNHRFLGGRRLYEIPQRLGYSVQPHVEDLNPYPHPYP